MSLIDANRRIIPECNINNEDDNIFARDVEAYNRSKKSITFSRHASLISLAILTIVLSIFTLNFGSSGWTVGNLLTFMILVAAMMGAAFFGRAWNKHYTMLTTLRQEGVPCKLPEKGGNQVIYCGLQEQSANPASFFSDLM